MYQALYRKYRPRCFCDVAGQEHVTETLRRQIVGGRLSHAYLFVGTRGTGKTTCAKILSRAVNCQNPVDGEPCNKCASCTGIENGSILDVLELDAASNNGVDNVRALREEAIYTPASVKKRVYIVDEVHMLSNAAFNALLKILEEPPEHLVFILATTELHKVPATILSRCQRFSFKRLSASAIASRLNLVAGSEGLTLTPDAADKLAALADGSMRDGLSLLDQCASGTVVDLQRVLDTVGLAGQQELLRLVGAAAGRDIVRALGIIDSLYNDGRDMASLLNELASLIRDVLVYKLSPDSPLLGGGFSGKELSWLSKKFMPERLLSCLGVVKEALFGLSRGGNVKLSVEMCLIRICDERLSGDVPAMLARISKLETDFESGVRKLEPASFDVRDAGGVHDSASEQDISKSRVPDAASGQDVSEPRAPDAALGQDVSEPRAPDAALEPGISEPRAPDAALEPGISEPRAPDAALEPGVSEPRAPGSALENEAPGGGFWEDILDILKSDDSVFALLSDSSNVKAELQGGSLTIRSNSPFIVSTIASKMFSDPLREAARKVLGRELVIRVEAGGGGESKREKLERLSAFDIVKFE